MLYAVVAVIKGGNKLIHSNSGIINMKIELEESNEKLIQNFKQLHSRQELAKLLEIEDKVLIYVLYRNGIANYYKTFDVVKKNGGLRKISAPSGSLKIIQSKLREILDICYNPRPCVQGYVKDRSVITNAEKHKHPRFILNIDVKGFFDAINFGRVRGYFLKKPFEFNKEISTIIAQICCLDGILPQGAPTSPIIANLICSRFDSEMIRFARKNNLFYTRYADDITFSSNRMFKKAVIRFRDDDFSMPVIAKPLRDIFKNNGFIINKDKIIFSTKEHRQEITGIIINEKLNVRRAYIKNIRCMLYAWKKFGYENASNEYFSKNQEKYQNYGDDELPEFENIVFGKINYLRMVRGFQDKIFRKYFNEYVMLTHKGKTLPIDFVDVLEDIVFIVECGAEQGTIFYTEEYGWITNYHVIKENSDENKISIYDTTRKKKLLGNVIKEIKAADLAILSVDDYKPENCLKVNTEYNFRLRESRVIVCGYPDHHAGDTLYINNGKIISERGKNGIDYYIVDKPIIQGNSGGPVLNEKDEIVGIASTGSTFDESDKSMFFGIIPIKNLNV